MWLWLLLSAVWGGPGPWGGAGLTEAVPCRHCTNTSDWSECYESCSGEFCFVSRLGEEVTQGCVSGLGRLRQGCYANRELCLCSEPSCNQLPSPRPFLQLPARETETSLTCRLFKEKNGVVEYDKECGSGQCWYREEEYVESGSGGRAVRLRSGSCVPVYLRPSYQPLVTSLGRVLLPDGCFSLQDDVGSVTRDCVCSSSARCQAPAPPAFDPRPTVACQMLFHSQHEADRVQDPASNRSRLCVGHACFISVKQVHGIGDFHVQSFRKGCVNASGSAGAQALLRPGRRFVSQGTVQEETWLCLTPNCNANRRTAAGSFSQAAAEPRTQPPPELRSAPRPPASLPATSPAYGPGPSPRPQPRAPVFHPPRQQPKRVLRPIGPSAPFPSQTQAATAAIPSSLWIIAFALFVMSTR